jgi:hypothetical protein
LVSTNFNMFFQIKVTCCECGMPEDHMMLKAYEQKNTFMYLLETSYGIKI